MFKGYVQTKGKKPLVSVKEREDFYSLQDVQALKEYGGILEKNLIMIDVDNLEQAAVLERIIQDKNIKCCTLKTSRGMHFYFKNEGVKTNKIGCILPIGLEADIKLGNKNTVVPLKIDGVERVFEEVSEPDSIPIWLQPVGNAVDFFGMTEGDGRNQELFNYILKLQSAGFTKEDARETIVLINKYVLKKPLDKRELDTILRDESFQKPTFVIKGKLQVDEFCRYLISQQNIKTINGILHIYQNGVYANGRTIIERAINAEIPNIARNNAGDIYWKLGLLAQDVQLSPPTHIVLGNGLYNISNGSIEDFSPSYVAKNKIATNYNPSAYSEEVDQVLDRITCQDKDLRRLLEEVIGYALYRRNELGKAFILTGHGSNGKSTFLEMLDKMIGEDNISSLSLADLSQRFKTPELEGKLVNIGDDISDDTIKDTAIFKKVVTGEKITIDRKNQDPQVFRNYSKLFFSANKLPKIKDSSHGLMRRLVIIPFNANFKRDNGGQYDVFIKDRLLTKEAMEYLLLLGIQGLKRVLKDQAFTEVKDVNVALEEYNKMNNPILRFVQEVKIENETTSHIYIEYENWCDREKEKSMGASSLGKELKKLGYESKVISKNGRSIRIYKKLQ
ncbi:MAG: DNA primase family protein [Cellulosilyticaceae bacterium]